MNQDKVHQNVMKQMDDRFRQFMRNGVWGTCVDCPRDNHQHAYPEFCANKQRSDHLLTPDELFEQYNMLSNNEFYKTTQQAG
jgi:hypothetical protein